MPKDNFNTIKDDRFNDSTPHEKRAEKAKEFEDGGEDNSWSSIDFDSIYSEGIQWLQVRGYRMEPDLAGVHCDHSIYKRTRIRGHDAEGYVPDNDIFTWQLISADEFVKVKELMIMFIDQHPDPKNASKLWSPLYSPTTEKRKPIYAFASREINLQHQKEYNAEHFVDGISLTATTEDKITQPIFKWLPQVDWFDDRIKELTPGDLLSILPSHEQEMLMLLIGRALVGRNRSLTTEGVEIRHSFRSMGIMVGRSAGLGKSTLMEHIMSAMKECGYKVSVFQNVSSRFGWGGVIASDLAYNDDLTPKSQRQLITSELTKSIVSGGTVKTEKKGIDAVETNSRCVMIANSNDYAKTDFFKMDSGMKSRVKLLSTHSQAKLESNLPNVEGCSKGTKDLRVKEHWEYLARKLKTTPRVMALWLMRLCANKFMESIKLETATEVRLVPNTLDHKTKVRQVEIVWDYDVTPGVNPLVEEIYRITRNLVIQVDKDATKDFIHFWRYCWATCSNYDVNPYKYQKITEEKLKQLLDIRKKGVLNYKTLGDIMNILMQNIKTISDQSLLLYLKEDYEAHPDEFYHPYHFLANVRFNHDTFNKAIMEIDQSLGMGTEESKIFERVFHHFTSVDGFRLVGSLTAITTYWDNSVDLDEKLQITHDRIMSHDDTPESFLTMMSSIYDDLRMFKS